ncbi:unnamed protein product [Diamesa serratosioi]
MSSQNETEVESLLMSPCWNAGTNGQDYLLDGHKLLMEHDLESLPSDSETQKRSMELLDNLLSNSTTISSNTNLAELKPLPPFTGYTGHLSINGISGHHYHAIAQRLPEENNNNYSQTSYQNQCGSTTQTTDHNIVSSSTCLPDSVLNSDGADSCLSDVKFSIEDIAAIIGSAIADTTVPNNRSDNGDTANDTRDSWMDLDAWIEDTCVPQDSKLIISHNDSLNDFIMPHSPIQSSSTLQSLLTHGYMPLLQNRLQNGPPIKIEAPTSTSYCNDLISTSTSPPGSVSSSTKIKRSRNPKKSSQSHLNVSSGNNNHQQQIQQQVQNVSAHSFPSPNDLSGLLGKEKPVHRCNICNRGFLNKSNIKVHLRTHTGEKPFRCEVCAKAFRQKAHLIKHQQIHKRIGQEHDYKCFICSKRFDLITHKDEHVKRDHIGENKCTICNKKKQTAISLETHMKHHFHEYRFLCSMCGKSFRFQNLLQHHMQIEHYNSIRFMCDHCTYETKFKINLERHQRTNSNICHVCNKQMASSTSLFKHVQVQHNNVRAFKCDLCDKTFGFKHSMVSHRNTHTGEKPFCCNFCSFRSGDRSTISKHKKKMHQDQHNTVELNESI